MGSQSGSTFGIPCGTRLLSRVYIAVTFKRPNNELENAIGAEGKRSGRTSDLSVPPKVMRNMANSYRPNILYRPPCGVPSETPGPHGHNDQGDPNVYSSFGDTPGPLGINDYAAPLPSPSLLYLLQHYKICVDSQNSNMTNYVIPLPSAITPPLISDSDIAEAATLLGVEQATIYAVSKVESGGRTGFDSKGRPKILFEARWFHKFTGGKYDMHYPIFHRQPGVEQNSITMLING